MKLSQVPRLILKKLVKHLFPKLEIRLCRIDNNLTDKENFGDSRESETCEKGLPLSGSKTAINYTDFSQDENNNTTAINLIDFAKMKFVMLTNYYLEYILKNSSNGIYSKTNREVEEHFNINKDKSSRLKKWALNENYLIPGIKSKKVMQVQENKIRTKLGQS